MRAKRDNSCTGWQIGPDPRLLGGERHHFNRHRLGAAFEHSPNTRTIAALIQRAQGHGQHTGFACLILQGNLDNFSQRKTGLHAHHTVTGTPAAADRIGSTGNFAHCKPDGVTVGQMYMARSGRLAAIRQKNLDFALTCLRQHDHCFARADDLARLTTDLDQHASLRSPQLGISARIAGLGKVGLCGSAPAGGITRRELKTLQRLQADEIPCDQLAMALEFTGRCRQRGIGSGQLGRSGPRRLIKIARIETEQQLSGRHTLPGIDMAGQNAATNLEGERNFMTRPYRTGINAERLAIRLEGNGLHPGRLFLCHRIDIALGAPAEHQHGQQQQCG